MGSPLAGHQKIPEFQQVKELASGKALKWAGTSAGAEASGV
jgi:hypothetical protein